MAKNRRKKKNNATKSWWQGKFFLPQDSKKYIAGVGTVLLAIIVALSFFERSGLAGERLKAALLFLVGKTFFAFPLILLFCGLIFFRAKYRQFFYSLLLAFFIIILGISGILEGLNPGQREGGVLGYLTASPLLKFFDFLVTQIIFLAVIIIGGLIFWHLLAPNLFLKRKEKTDFEEEDSLWHQRQKIELGPKEQEKRESLVSRVFQKVAKSSPRFKVKEVPSQEESSFSEKVKPEKVSAPELKTKSVSSSVFNYSLPPKDLLEKDGSKASPGDIQIRASVIRKTLQNFEIPVEMSEVNVGPTVTQYTLKPAEGIKLSKITALSNDLALALASHPIRIEAPIPGKALVGIEVPNKTRARVRLRELVEDPAFQQDPPLTLVLGKDVSGRNFYADLARMPHLLVAGSTGTGKTIFLNNLILSLLYKNSPDHLRFILVDPKRVEFAVYGDLPHLLAPVIFDVDQTINALKWLIGEMDRRFDIMSDAKTRDIASYNSKMPTEEFMPYIVLIVDELADLMASKGREMEAGIVRLAQMARAVGIHLVVATQRPSVEVITGLIKANITSRVTFQVASQVDSRTVLDTSGAEKLLGLGDLLYLAPEFGKPRRIQSAFVAEKEVRKVVDYLKNENSKLKGKSLDSGILGNHLAQDLKSKIESLEGESTDFYGEKDPLYEEAKREVILAKKASASLLQRRLRVGYARAARLIDMMEKEGVVGPGEGAKPREVYVREEKEQEDWQKI